jgi:uroporphyrin-3 C-methyltransferase
MKLKDQEGLEKSSDNKQASPPPAGSDPADPERAEPERAEPAATGEEREQLPPDGDGDESPPEVREAAALSESEAPLTSPAEPDPGERAARDSKSVRGLPILALLLALGALGLAAWLYLQEASRASEQRALETRLEIELSRISATADAAREAIDDAVAATRRANTELRELLGDERQRTAEQLATQRETLAEVEASLRGQRQQLLELRSTDRVDWSLAEAEYLLRLAYQRLLMAQDVNSAMALLSSADAILREVDDTDLLPAREAIARDLAALRTVPGIDVDGAWLRLEALAGRVDSLLLFELAVENESADELSEDAGWVERLEQGFRAAVEKISSYIVIRRREQPYETLIDPQWEQLVRQNLRMQIAQAQAALLSGNPVLYEASLATTRRWLQEFFDFNQMDVTALDREIQALMAVEITREYPDIGGSLAALKLVIDLRHADTGGP